MLGSFLTFVRNLPRRYSIGGVVLVAVLILGIHFATRPAATADTASQTAHVHIASVASLSSQTGPLPVTGKVTSLSEASILAQSSGEIVSLSHALGDRVAAGSVIATFDSSSQAAAVLQAQGAYDAAQAALTKASGSTAANTGLSSTEAASALKNSTTAVAASLQSTYAALDDAVRTKADALFSNAGSQTPVFLLTIPDSQLALNVVSERAHLESVLATASGLTNASASGTVDSHVDQMMGAAQTVEDFLTDIIQAVNETIPGQTVSTSMIASDQASLSAARTAVVNAVSALTSAKAAYDSAAVGAQTAANTAVGTGSDVAAAEANVKQALGALNSAKANLEKTVIRSPISGTIVSLAITKGDFVSSFSQVADVSNPGALEVIAYVTADDAKTLAVGGSAAIDTNTKGVIVSIAPALDPTTGKIQVKIGITGDQSALTDGDTVSVDLDRSLLATAKKTKNSSSAILIPINAAKITPSGPVVFTVSSSTLRSIPITLGTILGDQVTVSSGLTAETDIVTDARGLSDGQAVVVDTQ